MGFGNEGSGICFVLPHLVSSLAGLLEGGSRSECSLFTFSVDFVLCLTPFEEQGGHVL